MRVAVIGVGHVGLVTAACLARWGHDVVGMDDDERKIDGLRRGTSPFYEPGLDELIAEGVDSGRLSFTGDVAEALDRSPLAFVCVGTPSLPGGAPNLAYVEAVGRKAAELATGDLVLAEKSTVPANTGLRLLQVIEREQARHGNDHRIDVASNPEFLREGQAVADTLRPDRVVVGVSSSRAADVLREVYRPVVEEHGCPYVETDLPTAELIKHASNAFLATKISFINAVARICDQVGADVEQVAIGMGLDHRIGPEFLKAGLGYGGSCLLADETVLARRGEQVAHMSIGEFWQRVASTGIEGWNVLAWVPGRQVPEFLPVAAATARPYIGDIVEVRTKMGRRVRCTADHPFVVGAGERGGATTVRLAEQLSPADWLPLASGRPEAAPPAPRSTGPLAAVGAGVTSAADVIQRLDPHDLAAVRERGSYCSAENETYVPGEMDPDEDLWRMVGFLLTDGHRDPYTKRVPDLVWDAPVTHKRALLRGLWDGDGSWSKVNGGPSVVFEYGTVSRPLADGVLRLLGDLGLVASLRVGRTLKSTVDTYWIRLAGADQIEAALWLFPPEEAAEIRESIGGQSKRIAPTGYRRLEDGTVWVRVVGTRREPFDGLVYSVEVPGAHTIVTSGGLVTHNCFPKDVDAFIHLARSVGYDFRLLEEVRAINADMRTHVLELLRQELWHLEGKTVTLLGAAFKPGTDDLRAAPAMWLAEQLLEAGATVRVYDPVALPAVKEQLAGVELFEDPVAACSDAHAAVVCTEWEQVTALRPDQLAATLAYPIVIDGRNVFDPSAMAAAGIRYHGIGRPTVEPETRRPR